MAMISWDPARAPVRRIVWDWNGTLFDDAWLCRDVMNEMLVARGLPSLSWERYQREFDFPVIEYYRRLGYDFEKEPFDVVGTEFIRAYEQRRLKCALHEGALQALQLFQEKGLTQTVLSAYEHSTLESLLNHFGIRAYFEQVSGNADHYAQGKVENGLAWMQASGAMPSEVLLIGDTRHDAEVAAAMGVQCVLIEGGNQDRERLAACGVPLYPSLRAFVDMLER